jgi:asparagine synthase (glutamine-hydrolysing)
MCGIAGALSAGPVDRAAIEKMRDLLVHRGPDDAGIWSSEDGRVCLGHRRLKILDLSPDANQPFLSGDGRYALNFNGEIYNHQALRAELAAAGVRFRTRSDTEVLVEAFARWGERCLERVAGMFAFTVWDRLERRLFCARDRTGEKPFHYAVVGNSFVFSSELKALVAWPAFRRRIDHTALADFLTFGYVPDPKCIWEGCRKLPPGHSLSVELPREGPPVAGSPVRWWDLEFDPDDSVDDWGPEILETLELAADEMAFADVPVGTFLSGGVDSSSVAAALSRNGRSVRTFTIGFRDEEYDERPWARTVAELYRTQHAERLVEPDDVTSVIDRLLWHYDEPFNDHSYLPTYYVCREARDLVTVALSGDGGDELFAGYRKYRRLARRQALQPFLPAPAGELMARTAAALLPEPSGLRATARDYGRDPSDLLTAMMTTLLPREALERAARGPLSAALADYDPIDTVRSHLRNAPPDEVGLINSMRYLDLKLTLAGDILVKVDRASMAVSLEVRPVYLHRDILALAARIPPGALVRWSHAKRALKAALRPWLPRSLLYRKKAGFAMPLGQWFRGELRDLASSGNGGGPLEELVDPRFVEEAAGAHPSAGADASSVLHSLFFLRQWMSRWL